MVVIWSAAMDQRLLLAVLAVVKPDNNAVAKKWGELFAKEDIKQPTPRAITEHLGKLKKDMGISGAQSKGVARAPKKLKLKQEPKEDDEDAEAASTPSPQKSNCGRKRSRGSMSDEDASDNEQMGVEDGDCDFGFSKSLPIKESPCPVRFQAPRRAKNERKASWIEESSSESEQEYEVFDDEMESLQKTNEEVATDASSPPVLEEGDCIDAVLKEDSIPQCPYVA